MENPIISAPPDGADCYQIRRIRNYAWTFAAAWSLLLLSSAVMTIREHRNSLINLARAEARSAIDRDILYRRWGSSHGGVYIPVTEKSPPSPYLSHLPERDISTPSGKKLTLINPAYMTRQVYDLAKESDTDFGSGHLTSLNPLRPENAPDPWEKKALDSFNREIREVSEMVQINGQQSMRLMQAFVTEKSCLKCHSSQGYKEGDIRGGLSITIPAGPLIDATRRQISKSNTMHGMIWLFGLGMTCLGARQLTRNARGQMQIELELQDQNDELQVTEEMLRVQLDEYETSQMQLKESNSALQAIFDVSPLPIIISSYADGTVRDVNRTFCNSFGYGRDTVIGMTGFDLGFWSDDSERQHAIRILVDNQGLFDFPAKIRNGRGDVRSIRMHSTTIDFRNEPCLLNVLMDVTDQKRIEDELRQAQKMDVVGQLAGGLAHDFNNMLTAIIGSADLMERHVKDNPAQAALLKTIQEAAGRSAALTGQLLAFSRRGSSMAVHIWINKAVQSAIGLLERTIDRNIRLETRLTATNDLIIGDPGQLQNVLLNLGVNARDAMPDGGTITYATATLFLDAAYCGSHGSQLQPGHYVEISVSDTGTGIQKEIFEQIFEPFFTTKGIGKGTGLGLAAVYGTVKEHQGSVSVNSEPGVGTVFKLYLPLAAEQSSGLIPKDTLLRGSGGILLVDDELLIREIGQALLEEHGYQVYLAADGGQALEVYERERDHISLVIMDVIMPVMGGMEALRRLTASYPDIKVLLSSGFHQDESNDSFIALGAKGFVRKPYHAEELFKTVDDTMRSTG